MALQDELSAVIDDLLDVRSDSIEPRVSEHGGGRSSSADAI
ncbi:MAG: hypothetical protein VYC07_06440 [Pseudomonadota bacterium]|nr:hypothetical protein [Pseudomonadota bacterium]MEC8867616.1 hypothetical protein [Pseudomonadota bacterium]MEE3183426.1 hypothetical protein [Pseudomonadota bacterium]